MIKYENSVIDEKMFEVFFSIVEFDRSAVYIRIKNIVCLQFYSKMFWLKTSLFYLLGLFIFDILSLSTIVILGEHKKYRKVHLDQKELRLVSINLPYTLDLYCMMNF